MKTAKTHLELNLEGNRMYHGMGFYKYKDSKKHTRENMAPALNSMGILVTKYMEKTEVLKATFASLSTSRICLQEC